MTNLDTWDLGDRTSCCSQDRSSKMKTLQDLCLACIGENLDRINRVSQYLAPLHKEILLERLAFHDMLTPKYLPHITYHLSSPVLKRVNLYKCEQVSDGFLMQLAATGCKLEYVSIHECLKVTDAGIQSLTRGQNELKTLILRKLTKLTDRAFTEVSSSALQKVDLRSCSSINKQGITTLLTNNPGIQHLVLVRCSKLVDEVFAVIAQTLQASLEVLDIADLHILTDTGLAELADHCPNLMKLNLMGCNRITHLGLSRLFEKCQRLKNVDLSYVSTLKDVSTCQCLFVIPDALYELSLCGLMLGEAEKDMLVEALCRLQSLRTVRLCGIPAIDDEALDTVLRAIGGSLEQLDLSGGMMSSLSDHGLRAVSKHCHALRVLALSLLRDVTGVTLLPLLKDQHRANQLHTLLLGCRKLDVEVLNVVAKNCHNVEKLETSGLNIVEDTLLVSLAANCRRLSYIGLKGCRQVTDLGVCELAYNCPLAIVVLAGAHQVTDRSVMALANHCPYLEEIYLSGCAKVSKAAVHYLKDICIPRVYVSHKVPNADPAQLMAHNLDTGQYIRADQQS